MTADFGIKDLAELRAFHRQLLLFNQTMDQELHNFRGDLEQINEVWDDPMYHRLNDSLDLAFKEIESYLKVAPESEAYLGDLIRDLEEIQNRFGG